MEELGKPEDGNAPREPNAPAESSLLLTDAAAVQTDQKTETEAMSSQEQEEATTTNAAVCAASPEKDGDDSGSQGSDDKPFEFSVASDEGEALVGFGERPRSCPSRACESVRRSYCGMCCLGLALAVGLAVVITLLPVAGKRVRYDQYTADIAYEIVEGRPMLMELSVARDGRYATRTTGISRPGTLETQEIHDGSTATVVERVFDRYVCEKLTVASSSAFVLETQSTEWVLQSKDMPCPAGSQVNTTPRCEKWVHAVFIGQGFYESTLVLDRGTKHPLYYEQNIAGTRVAMSFRTFKPGAPNESAFVVPQGLRCADYRVKEETVPLFADFNPKETKIGSMQVMQEVEAAANRKGWVAVKPKNFANLTLESFAGRFGNMDLPLLLSKPRKASSTGAAPKRKLRKDVFIPESYDVRDEYSKCTTLSTILDQGSCGCCYAIAAATVLAGRRCIATGGKVDTQLSAQWIIGCDDTTLGCSGGWVQPVWNFLHRNGTTSAVCSSFIEAQTKCPQTCDNGAPIELFRSGEPYDLHGDTAEETVAIIQQEILENGPVEAAYHVFSDFVCSPSLHRSGCCLACSEDEARAHSQTGLHERLSSVPADTDEHVPGRTRSEDYWVGQLLWHAILACCELVGRHMGDARVCCHKATKQQNMKCDTNDFFMWLNRTFKIAQGTNECGFESRVAAALPLV